MASRSPDGGRNKSWVLLPPELRWEIWEYLINNNAPFLSYVLVCRQWQAFFERFTFRSLMLHQNDITLFRKLVKGYRRGFVRHIWLRIELLEYGCPECADPESEADTRKNNTIFSNALCELFELLGQWGKEEAGGITFELSAHSPSDWKHHFKELTYRSRAPNIMPLPGSDRPHDPIHGWVYGRPNRLNHPMNFPRGVYEKPVRVLGPGIRFLPILNTPHPVPVIRSFLIRRQFYRSFSALWGVGPIVEALPNLENLSYEYWTASIWEPDGSDAMQRRKIEHRRFVSKFLRFKSSLRSVSIFQDFNRSLSYWYMTKYPVAYGGLEFVEMSIGLERMYASFVIDAQDFFLSIKKLAEHPIPPLWDRLQILVLTAKALEPNVPLEDIDKLFCTAAKIAAARMPNLRRMELWSGGLGHGCLFRYKVHEDGAPTVTLTSTWFCRLSSRATEAWEVLVRKHGHEHPLHTKHHDLDPSRMKTHGTMLQYLAREPHGVISYRSRNELLQESIWSHVNLAGLAM